jgi:MFS family permease
MLVGVGLALLLSALDQTIVGTAMPRIIAELQGFDRYAWVTTAYLLCSTAVVPIVGKLSDLYGRKLPFVSGIVVFLAASGLCGASQDILQLVLFRGLQGLGAGFLMAMAFTSVGDLFPPARRGRV